MPATIEFKESDYCARYAKRRKNKCSAETSTLLREILASWAASHTILAVSICVLPCMNDPA